MAERITDEQRRHWALQVEALKEEESFDEGTPEWRTAVEASADRWRAAHGIPPLKPWWADKTEHLLHERARALGLLG